MQATGLAWTANFNEKLFAEAGFGGLRHNGELEGNTNGPSLGCRFLVHVYLGYIWARATDSISTGT